MNLHQKIEKLIREHIKEHQSEINVAKELLNKLNISSSNKLTQDYSFDLTATGEKFNVNQSIEITKASIEANSDWNDGWTKQYYADKVKELEGKSKHYYDWDRNGKIVNPFFETPDYTELPDTINLEDC